MARCVSDGKTGPVQNAFGYEILPGNHLTRGGSPHPIECLWGLSKSTGVASLKAKTWVTLVMVKPWASWWVVKSRPKE